MNAAPVYPVFNTRPRSGIVFLRNAVASYFEALKVPAVVAPVGLKYRTFTLNQSFPANASRVVFIPGEFDPSGDIKPRKYGSLSRETRNAGSVVNPRELAEWSRPITVSIWGAPAPGQTESEQDSIALVEDLMEQVVRGIYSASIDGVGIAGSIEFGEVSIVSPPNEKSFGAELLLSLIQTGPLYGETLEVVAANPNLVQRFT